MVPSRKTVNSYVVKIYQEGHEELKVEIAQYITASWKQKTRVLATRVIEDRHTGEKIAEQILQEKCYMIRIKEIIVLITLYIILIYLQCS